MISTWQARGSLLLLLAALFVYMEQANAALAVCWEGFRKNGFVRQETFEPIVAVVSFFVFTRAWHYVDFRRPELHKYRLWPSPDLSAWEVEGYPRQEVIAYIVPMLLYDLLFPRRAQRLQGPPPSAARVLLEVAAALLLYDFCFFFCHLAMHKVPLLRKIHARHHMMGDRTRATDATRVSVAEQVVLVGISIASLNVLRCHAISRALFNICIAYMVCEIHAGYDMPWMLHNVVPGGLVGGARRHEHHHRRGDRYYQQFFTYLDDALEWAFPAKGGRAVDAGRKEGVKYLCTD